MKQCYRCKETKDTEKFSRAKNKDKLSSYCIPCERLLSAKRTLKHRSTVIGFITFNLRTTRKCALKRGLVFDVDKEYILDLFNSQKGMCAISKEPLTLLVGQGRVLTNLSIDRIDSDQGYTKGNIQLVCSVINFMKHTMNLEELKYWCRKVLES